ncbi:MAG: hypothetical protein ACQEWW_16865 [Bacillota bacterium]
MRGLINRYGLGIDMFNNKRNKRIIEFFERNVRNSVSELDSIIFKEHQKVVEELNSRGVLASGMTASAILKMLEENIIDSCENALSLIDTFQNKNKLKIKEHDLNDLSELYTSSYISCYLDKIEKVYYVSMERYVGKESAINISNQVVINHITNKISKIVRNKIEDIKIYNKLQQEDPSVRIAKKNTIKTIFITLIVATATIYFNVFFNK